MQKATPAFGLAQKATPAFGLAQKATPAFGLADTKPLRFIGEPIQAQFDQSPMLEKKPGCPDQFVWGEETYRVIEILQEWHDYSRRGRMVHNMRPEYADLPTAVVRGALDVIITEFVPRLVGFLTYTMTELQRKITAKEHGSS